MKIYVVTYLYEAGIKYIDGFIATLKKQSEKKFTLVIFNDGVKNAAAYFKEFEGEIKVVEASGTPTEIRFQSFTYLYKTDCDQVIFQDIDDEMSANRVRVLSNLLQHYAIVSNDLSLMNDEGIVYKESIWKRRLGDMFKFDYTFIKDKNIAGIGNSGVRRMMLGAALKYSTTPKVGDWFMFYQLLFLSFEKAVFTTQCQTHYRQHDDNMAGVRKFSKERLDYVIAVKNAQYEGLQETGYDVSDEKKELKEQEAIIESGNYNVPSEQNVFWWEETNFLKD